MNIVETVELEATPAVHAPLTAAQIIARYHAAQGTSSTTTTRAPGRRRKQPEPRTLLPAFIKPVPIRVVVRPALVAATVVATVAAFEVPNLHHASSSTAAPAKATASASPVAAPPAGVDVAARADAANATRVSRATRRATTAPAVPLMKPGQTVPGVWVRPGTGYESSCFCMRWGTMHWGIDLAAEFGAPIYAVGDGVVIDAGPAEGFGNWIVIQHSNGDVSIYGHMKYYFVQKGQTVKAGDKIALVGSEGYSTGPHLHFEIHQGGLNGEKIDPVPWLKARGIDVGAYNPN